ncbi:hypothetical protein DYY67_1049 [Candidatus Nitrosotalea sp. TS]|nr:hypothetical protein [Candidatus Nitrosotalea sp. TS]
MGVTIPFIVLNVKLLFADIATSQPPRFIVRYVLKSFQSIKHIVTKKWNCLIKSTVN